MVMMTMGYSVMVKVLMRMNGVMKNVKGFESTMYITNFIEPCMWFSDGQLDIKSVCGNPGGLGYRLLTS